MTATLPLVSFAAAFAVSWLLGCGVLRWLQARQVLDVPNARSSHLQATVRGGGLAIALTVLAALGALAVFQNCEVAAQLALPLIILAGISFWDDLRSVPVWARFLVHVGGALIGLWGLGCTQFCIELTPLLTFELPFWLGLGLATVWLTGYTNAFNFMDGIDGLAGFQVVLTGAGSAVLAGLASGRWDTPSVVFAWVVAGAATGFLPYNFPRARMFMGDVGSAPLGFLLAMLVLWTARDMGWWLLIPLMLLHANFVLDTGITLVRRILRGEQWFRPHREHFYQRLLRSGRSHSFVTLWEAGLQMAVLCLLVAYLYVGVPVRLGIIAAVVALWGGFFFWCERAYRAAGSRVR